MNENLNVILGIELMCAVQGIEFRAPLKTSPTLQAVIAITRTVIAPLEQDRYLAPDIDIAAGLILGGNLLDAVEMPDFLVGRPDVGHSKN